MKTLLEAISPTADMLLAQRVPLQDGEIEIYAKWDQFGFIATSPQYPKLTTGHCVGPRAAADALAAEVFEGQFKIRTGHRNQYFACWKARKP